MNKYHKIIPCLVICLFIIYGCEKEQITTENTVVTGAISFKNVIVPIFQSKCIGSGCHGNGGQAPNLSTNPLQNLIQGNYIDTISPASSNLYVQLTTGSMTGLTTSTEQQEILNWIKQGAKNN